MAAENKKKKKQDKKMTRWHFPHGQAHLFRISPAAKQAARFDSNSSALYSGLDSESRPDSPDRNFSSLYTRDWPPGARTANDTALCQ
jgi:hypothetical protein